ncbi:salt stress response/antifungal domain protein [Medicago truncatula]|uniref:Salt stress response/antifungal domain protein n=1 Tax=Medicago truncatula TaxID=3880 RepID=G7ZZG2_MEDTR|nr:salt stress response/antifungal domain protein [Medicago truncatula]
MAKKLILIFIIRFISIISLFTKSIAQSPNYVGDDCHNSTEQSLTATYKSNLNKVLSLLSSDAIVSKGYNHTSIGENTIDAVYGLYDCRGDVTGSFCQFCVSTAASDVLQRCPNRASAVIWYNFCIFRYSNHNFFGNLTTSPSWQRPGSKNITNPQELDKAEDNMQSLISEATLETNKMYAMGEFNLSIEKRYGLVQCSRDLNEKQCNQCLEAMLDKVPKCCGTKIGWQVLAPSCLMKYDDFMFYQLTSATSAPLPNPGLYGR